MRILSLIALFLAVSIPIAACGDDDSGGGGSSGYGGGGGDSAEEEGGAGGDSAKDEEGGGDDGEDGGAAGGGGGGQAQTLRLAADPGGALSFDKSSLTARAGRVTLVMDNPSDLPHAVEIEGGGVEVAGETVGNGGVSRASAELEPGEYEYYCPVGNHADAGMEGTLTVR